MVDMTQDINLLFKKTINMDKPKFYKAVLEEIPVDKIIEHCYPIHHKEITLEERLGDCSCYDCGKKEWWLYPKESAAVRDGGKDYIQCINCGFITHL
jgi:predicted RNA-binding Zn-ribbon protein involved in translation (DUF1610 family)